MNHTVTYPKSFEPAPQTTLGTILRELLAATPLAVFIEAVRSNQQPTKARASGIHRAA